MCLTGENIGSAIKEIIGSKDMTQGDIMRSTGFERSYISKLISGKIQHPRLDTIHKISKALDMGITEFINFVINSNNKKGEDEKE